MAWGSQGVSLLGGAVGSGGDQKVRESTEKEKEESHQTKRAGCC